MFDFINKKVIVTGATGGIGDAIVNRFIDQEAKVLATGTNIEKLNLPFIHSRGFGDNKDKEKWPRYSSLGSTLKEATRLGKVEILSGHIAEKLVLKKYPIRGG